jgi:hypothetical protein
VSSSWGRQASKLVDEGEERRTVLVHAVQWSVVGR